MNQNKLLYNIVKIANTAEQTASASLADPKFWKSVGGDAGMALLTSAGAGKLFSDPTANILGNAYDRYAGITAPKKRQLFSKILDYETGNALSKSPLPLRAFAYSNPYLNFKDVKNSLAPKITSDDDIFKLPPTKRKTILDNRAKLVKEIKDEAKESLNIRLAPKVSASKGVRALGRALPKKLAVLPFLWNIGATGYDKVKAMYNNDQQKQIQEATQAQK